VFLERRGNLFIGRFVGLWGNPFVFHGFSTRKGGVSSSPYDTLNLGFNTADDPQHTETNRNRFFSALGISSENLAIPQQIHGTNVEIAKTSGIYPETDAIVTNVPELGLVIQVADCVPIFLYDPNRRVIGLVHSGWKGSREKLGFKVIKILSQAFQSNPSEILAWIGPSIGPCCYSVNQEVASYFSGYVQNGKLDLWAWNRDILIEAGLNPRHVRVSRLCTACHSEWFFSHRKSGGNTGRMMAVIGLKKKESI